MSGHGADADRPIKRPRTSQGNGNMNQRPSMPPPGSGQPSNVGGINTQHQQQPGALGVNGGGVGASA